MEEKQIKKRKKKGFTLIELIIVLAVIAIIAAIAIPNFTKVRADSKVKADTQSCETIKRIVLTNLADDKLPVNATINVTFTGSKAVVDLENASANCPKYVKTDFESDLKDVKKPQEDGATGYTIKIDKGDVTVTTDKTAETSTS